MTKKKKKARVSYGFWKRLKEDEEEFEAVCPKDPYEDEDDDY